MLVPSVPGVGSVLVGGAVVAAASFWVLSG